MLFKVGGGISGFSLDADVAAATEDVLAEEGEEWELIDAFILLLNEPPGPPEEEEEEDKEADVMPSVPNPVLFDIPFPSLPSKEEDFEVSLVFEKGVWVFALKRPAAAAPAETELQAMPFPLNGDNSELDTSEG
jgi:hypothetical protein